MRMINQEVPERRPFPIPEPGDLDFEEMPVDELIEMWEEVYDLDIVVKGFTWSKTVIGTMVIVGEVHTEQRFDFEWFLNSAFSLE